MKRNGAKNLARVISALFVSIAVSASVVLPAAADDPLTQHVDSSEQVVREEATIERGHVDLGPKIVDSKPEILARDDSGETPIWRPLDTLVFRVSDSGRLQVPLTRAIHSCTRTRESRTGLFPRLKTPRSFGWDGTLKTQNSLRLWAVAQQ